MNSIGLIHQLRRSNSLFLMMGALYLISCTQNAGVSVDGGTPGQSGGSGYLSLTKFQSKESANWVLGSSGELRTNSTTLTLEGTCERGVDKIKVKINGTDSGTDATCTDLKFTWTKASAFAANSTATLELTAYSVFDAALDGGTLTKSITIDTTAPTAPATVTVNSTTVAAGGSIVVSNSNGYISVVGNVSSLDAVDVTATDLTGLFPTKTSSMFNFTSYVNNGESRTITFSIFDDVGNSSTVAVTATYTAALSSGTEYIHAVGAAIDTATRTSGSYKLERATVDAIGSNTATSGSYTIEVGTTNFLKQLE